MLTAVKIRILRISWEIERHMQWNIARIVCHINTELVELIHIAS